MVIRKNINGMFSPWKTSTVTVYELKLVAMLNMHGVVFCWCSHTRGMREMLPCVKMRDQQRLHALRSDDTCSDLITTE